MAPPPEAAVEQRARLRRLGAMTAAEGRRLWRQVDVNDIVDGWRRRLARLLVVLTEAQRQAAAGADAYVAEALAELGQAAGSGLRVVPEALAGIASDGRPLDTLLEQPARLAVAALAGGRSPERAMAAGEASLVMIARTQVADAGRVAEGLAIAARPGAGYTRLLVGTTNCPRCVVLAGRFYEWNDGFLRHPQCDCVHVPTAEVQAGDLMTNPRDYFDSLSSAEQDATFGEAGARAIRDGADIAQVVNARRGMRTAAVFGREGVQITLEGTTRRGVAGRRLIAEGARSGGGVVRLMPEQIYEEATDRDHALRLLWRNGYLLGPQPTPSPRREPERERPPDPEPRRPNPVPEPRREPDPPPRPPTPSPAPELPPLPTRRTPASLADRRPEEKVELQGPARQQVIDELTRQTALAPHVGARLVAVDAGPVDANILAHYTPTTERVRMNPLWRDDVAEMRHHVDKGRNSGWFSPSGGDHAASIFAHEYGHHVHFSMGSGVSAERLQHLVATIGRELGISVDVSNIVRFEDSVQALNRALEANIVRVMERVSVYATTNAYELLAEIWQEYSTLGARARPHIRVIGDLMREIAEAASKERAERVAKLMQS